MKVLITGGTGIVGSHLIPELLQMGYACRLLVRNPGSLNKQLAKEVEIYQGDIVKPASLKNIAEGITHVVHLAALGHVSAISDEAYQEFINVNVQGTKNLLEACSGADIERFVHFSSTAAMGLIRKKGPVAETDLPQPATPYQKSKLQSEKAAFKKGLELDIPIVVLRPCMIYGKGGFGEFHKMAILMRKGLFPKVGRGCNLTPLVHVSDVVQATIGALKRGRAGETYLVASDRSLAMDELRAMIMQAWGKSSFYPYVPVWFMKTAAWGFEQIAKITNSAPLATRYNIANTVWDREFSTQKAKHEIGYQPRVGFEEGITETVTWFAKKI